jgi:hypothetical protein
MAIVAVIDAQTKTRITPEEEVKKSSWWKRMMKPAVSQG